MEKQIELCDLSIKLNDRELYNHINLTINEGDRFIFLGPNGIGKTLLLETIFYGHTKDLAEKYNGLSITGEIRNSKEENLLDPDTKRQIAYVSQDDEFYNGFTLKAICESACTGVQIELDEDKLNYLLKKFGILEKKNLRIKNNVSFGEGKIVHIVSKLLKLQATNILFMDEPLNHLSFKNSMIFNEILLEEIKKNPSLIKMQNPHTKKSTKTATKR